MKNQLKPIETVYNGYRFRSRQEARFAVLLDYLSIDYDYELEGFDLGDNVLYLPDFCLREPSNGWVEIKGDEPTEEDIVKCTKLALMSKRVVTIFWGPFDPEIFYQNSISFIPNLFNDIFTSVEGVGPAFLGYNAWDKSKVYDAVIAARQARFEHGETPEV